MRMLLATLVATAALDGCAVASNEDCDAFICVSKILAVTCGDGVKGTSAIVITVRNIRKDTTVMFSSSTVEDGGKPVTRDTNTELTVGSAVAVTARPVNTGEITVTSGGEGRRTFTSGFNWQSVCE